jgi:hypothetical protein
MISYGDVEEYHPIRIVMTDEVKELMKSKEAQHYMNQINKAGLKLQRFITQNTKKETENDDQSDRRST